MLELIVLLAILIAIAGTVVPLVSAEIEDSRTSRAIHDASRIAAAVNRFAIDTGKQPRASEKASGASALLTSGASPERLPLGPVARLADRLGPEAAPPASAPAGWKGPYLGEVGADPWGRAYAVIVPAPGSRGRLWVLSA
ncbi:MAG TPA: type II secretion system protein GspG, partial [Planctomycetota bacterium]|nr:type II secretion system protein GspG [Planctomycetota bacterium]